ncbi:hypothetical protein LEP1GSC050_3027 [Leptospira broomii serovar Hurstbridge str. 5399]|uniref:Uncharacterized protein n=1 Tax=Leptospira broomii serovar Hurstbridge str. 5399 TaxID=1049789 RepID=T0GKY1_9LEPT|nr:hypothetical protein [Leptospira broomii]EQA46033.1 hypothetical protein LEP1GSC050_3027 [Leptospira broomii serovar Hurstbridge str. 5399]
MTVKDSRPLDPSTGNPLLQGFLRVKKLNEVVSYYMNDKVTHSLYKAIAAATSYKNAKSRHLFEPHHRVQEVGELTQKEMDLHLKRLLEDGTVSQLAYFMGDELEQQPTPRPCFAAFPEGESLDLSRIYLELLDVSVISLIGYLDRKPELTKPVVWENLEADWETKSRKEKPFPQLFLYLREAFHDETFSILPSPEFVKDFLFELEDDLTKKGRVVDIPGYGLFSLKNTKEAIQIIEYIDDFIQTKGMKALRHILSEAFQRIAMEEKFYYSDPSHPETTKFRVARAEAFSQALQSGNPGLGSSGMLGVVLIRTLAEIAEKEMQRQHSEKERNQFQEIKRGLLAEAVRWDRKVLFIPDKEFRYFPDDLKRMLLDDLEIAYATWEAKGGTIHAFLHKNPESVRQIVLSLSGAHVVEAWKILCIRQLIEAHEPQIKSVFKESEFVKAYGKVLRKGYMEYFPWFYPILDLIGIGRIFQDFFFSQAKDKIRIQQNFLKGKNLEIAKKDEQARVQERLKEEEKIRHADQRSKLSSLLDEYYFKKKHPPLAADIQALVSEFSADTFYQILEREKFVLLTWEGSKEKYDQILCYSSDESFRTKAREIHKVFSERLGSLQNKIRTAEEEESRVRITRVIKYIDTWFSSNKGHEKSTSISAQNGKEEDGDPYESFRREIQKLRQKAPAA